MCTRVGFERVADVCNEGQTEVQRGDGTVEERIRAPGGGPGALVSTAANGTERHRCLRGAALHRGRFRPDERPATARLPPRREDRRGSASLVRRPLEATPRQRRPASPVAERAATRRIAVL